MSTSMRSRGFTLVELMVTVAIVAILAAIAYPSYTGYVERARQAEAKARLLDAVTWMERSFALHNQYPVLDDAALAQAGYGQSPGSGKAYYKFGFEASEADAFKLKATFDRSVWSVKRCDWYSIDHQGRRDASHADCWKR